MRKSILAGQKIKPMRFGLRSGRAAITQFGKHLLVICKRVWGSKMMHTTVHGIHHVTAVAGDAQQNLDFYVGVLGMRLVKKTVNQDAPHIYHLFYADSAGTPGTDITFFPWPDIAPTPGRVGIGLTVEVPFAIRQGSMAYWRERLVTLGVQHDQIETRFGEPTLPFSDPDGLRLALVETANPRQVVPWADSPVPAEHQVCGMHY